MKFKELFCKLGEVPELDLKKQKQKHYFSTLLCFPKILWNANSFYHKGQIDGKIWGECGQ